ncbi:HyaD/HybD family hydrogenase maturation endopeptidase [Aestuariirhabdus litorea]|uniref:HyaD/HybD family hydrogenase maturation endopeptidase n=1 Tax=Aestuariirhabdus litorea TaxID=2528527 RepID=A0A3P3VLN2_9GAMM|nr:HyaD/HybD family hydrogenase maturation endopeptidase [Aestuariirhabdus litorea]RRJ83661.1 HyaD/HybD family hydrogenase maturation endopeptidase [Aestuariirhabdus litorea]RWW96883.1 HyaD/HybD family hydrogenase maturation endopeptidase [Endozoicomonadaceae bacterium GTF-13]
MTILVLGVGNILLTDEGVGVRVVEALESRYQFSPDVDLVDGGTAGMELLDTIASRDHVILIDAVHTGDAPGTLVTLRDDEVPALFRQKISPHQLGISDLLAIMSLTGEMPNHFTLFGVTPISMETGVTLTPEVNALLEQMVQLCLDELERLGVTATPLPQCAVG